MEVNNKLCKFCPLFFVCSRKFYFGDKCDILEWYENFIYPKIEKITKEIIEKEYRPIVSKEFLEKCLLFTPDTLYTLFFKNKVIFLLEGDNLIGAVSFYTQEDFCKIVWIFVNEKYRKRGFGSYLLKRVEEICRELRVKRIILSCIEKVSKFYEKNGYKKVKEKIRYGQKLLDYEKQLK